MTVDKGIEDFAAVLLEHLHGRDDVGALIVGELDSNDTPSRHVIAQLERNDRCVFAGWVCDTAVIYPAIDILVFPSYREGLPNAVLEAQACGVPVVGYASTGTVDAVDEGKSGLLVATGNVAALASAVAGIIDDGERRRALSDAGPQWIAEHFARERLWTQLGDSYHRWLDYAGSPARGTSG
jgi:glycosyltransferase involved in cell wall biosynthesis